MQRKELIAQARQWVEQEKVWGGMIYAGEKPSVGAGQWPARKSDPVSIVIPTPVSSPSDSPDRRADQRSAPTVSTKSVALDALYEQYKDCVRCSLGTSRIKFVFGVGNPDTKVLFIGEGPGYEEDRKGEPFVGKSGQLLDKMMAAIDLSRQTNAYIANIVKCHPMTDPQTPEARGNDRPPTPEEVETCSTILLQQIAIIQPRVIMTLGSPSTKMILRTKDAITGLRGKFAPFPVDAFYPETGGPVTLDAATRETLRQIRVLPTFHPAALLRNPNLKPDTWTDLKLLREALASN